MRTNKRTRKEDNKRTRRHAETDTSFFRGQCIFEVASPAIGEDFAIASHVHAPYRNRNVFKAQGGAAYEYACWNVM